MKNINNEDEINTNKKEDFIRRKQIVIDDNKVTAYFVLYEKSLEIKGTMHAFEKEDI